MISFWLPLSMMTTTLGIPIPSVSPDAFDTVPADDNDPT